MAEKHGSAGKYKCSTFKTVQDHSTIILVLSIMWICSDLNFVPVLHTVMPVCSPLSDTGTIFCPLEWTVDGKLEKFWSGIVICPSGATVVQFWFSVHFRDGREKMTYNVSKYVTIYVAIMTSIFHLYLEDKNFQFNPKQQRIAARIDKKQLYWNYKATSKPLYWN